jgi:hypothetical protein
MTCIAKPAAKPPKAKAPPISKNAHSEDESGHVTDAAPPKPKPKTKRKGSSKSSKSLPKVLEEREDDDVPLKPKDKPTKPTKTAKTKAPKTLGSFCLYRF